MTVAISARQNLLNDVLSMTQAGHPQNGWPYFLCMIDKCWLAIGQSQSASPFHAPEGGQ